ncbi:MAG TPA: MFS transporter [Bacillales bacterium]|nr:MFS transporter [Bacillales bacterium]
MSLFIPLKHRSFRLVFSGQVLSDFGNWVYFIALTVLISYSWHLGAAALSALTIVFGIPWVVIGPLCSVWVDRLPKKAVMISCDLLRAAATIGLVFAPNLYVLLFFVFIIESLGSLFDPARQAVIRMTVPEAALAEASSLSQLSINATKIIAPAVGGALLIVMKAQGVFIIETVIFLLSAFILSWLKVHSPEEDSQNETGKKKYWVEWSEGFKYIFSKKMLAYGILMTAIGMFFVFLYDGFFVLWARKIGFGKESFGLVLSMIGFGSISGAALVGQWAIWKSNPLRFMCLSGMLSGFLIVCFGLGGLSLIHMNLTVWMAIVFLLGVTGMGTTVPFGYILQTQTSAKLMGRVSSSSNALINFSMLLAPALGAVFVSWLGIGAVFLISGIAFVLLGFFFGLMITFQAHLNEKKRPKKQARFYF